MALAIDFFWGSDAIFFLDLTDSTVGINPQKQADIFLYHFLHVITISTPPSSFRFMRLDIFYDISRVYGGPLRKREPLVYKWLKKQWFMVYRYNELVFMGIISWCINQQRLLGDSKSI